MMMTTAPVILRVLHLRLAEDLDAANLRQTTPETHHVVHRHVKLHRRSLCPTQMMTRQPWAMNLIAEAHRREGGMKKACQQGENLVVQKTFRLLRPAHHLAQIEMT